MTFPILVADDNPVDRRILTRFVTGEGYSVVEAENGAEAVALYESAQPQIVLMDALMPIVDGFEAARQIKQQCVDDFVPIIFLTALTQAEELARCLDAGGDDFLSKPYNRTILRAKLEAAQRQKGLHQTLKKQRDEIQRNSQQLLRDQDTAKVTFDRIVHREHLEQPFIHYLSSPLALFNGDVLLAAPTPRRTLNVLVGDFTGHGLTASIGAMPLADSFYTLTARGSSLRTIAAECNRRLTQVLSPGTFCCATFAEINFARGHIEFWSGGLPPSYLVRGIGDADEQVRSFPAAHLPLGLLGPERFDATTQAVSVAPNERLLLYSDGVVEAGNAEGEQFGSDRLEAVLSKAAPTGSLVDEVVRELSLFVDGTAHEDDLTLLEVALDPAIVPDGWQPVQSSEGSVAPPEWSMTYQVQDSSLATFQPVAVLLPVLAGVPVLRSRLDEIGVVMTELYANALDHGVLGLSSELKQDAAGFLQFFSERTEKLQSATGAVTIELNCVTVGPSTTFRLSVTDTGQGFEPKPPPANEASDPTQSPSYHGRGLKLMRELSSELKHDNGGRTTIVTMTIDGEER